MQPLKSFGLPELAAGAVAKTAGAVMHTMSVFRETLFNLLVTLSLLSPAFPDNSDRLPSGICRRFVRIRTRFETFFRPVVNAFALHLLSYRVPECQEAGTAK